jgi:hypothetical protein
MLLVELRRGWGLLGGSFYRGDVHYAEGGVPRDCMMAVVGAMVVVLPETRRGGWCRCQFGCRHGSFLR